MNIRGLGLFGVLVLACFTCQAANGAIIAGWTFEPTAPADVTAAALPAFAANTGTGTLTGLHASASTAWSTPVGNGSTDSISSNNWAVGDYLQFEVSTINFVDLVVTWDQTSSSTGPGVFDLEYRIGTSGAFTTASNDYVVLPNQAGAPGAGAWGAVTAIPAYSYSVDLSSIDALEEQPVVQFRITMATTADSTPPGSVVNTGTSRVDNFVVNATAVPEPSTYALVALGLAGFLGLRRSKQS